MNIVLVGFMGAGKSSVGKVIAERLGWVFMDTDAMIERETGFTVRQLFEKGGEAAFRDLEAKTILLVSLMNEAVIATGGGAPLRPENMAALESNGATFCLTAKPETILERLKGEVDVRPLLKGRDPEAEIRRLLDARRDAYARAKYQVPTDGLSSVQVAERVISLAGLK